MASHEDARLIVEFSNWARTWGFHEANSWVTLHQDALQDYRSFGKKFPPGTPEYRHPFTVLGYFENLGLFYKHKVIDEALLFDWLDFRRPWRILESFALADRVAEGNDDLWIHFELLARDQASTKARLQADAVEVQ